MRNPISRHFLRRFGGALIIGAFALSAGSAMAEPPKTIEPGKLTVGINGDMPMTSVKDGKLIGTDGAFIGMKGFGASAPIKDLYQRFEITAEAVAEATLGKLNTR